MIQSRVRSTFRRLTRRMLSAALVASCALAAAALAGDERQLVPRSELARQPLRAGESVVEEYGDMVLVEGAEDRSPGRVRRVTSHLAFVDFPFDTAARAHVADEPPARLLRPRSSDATPALHVVAFHGPVKDAWLDALRALGAELVSYLPENAYIVRVSHDRLADIRALRSGGNAPVTWVGYYQPAYRIARSLIGASGQSQVRIQLQNTTRGRLLARVVSARSQVVSPLRERGQFLTMIVRAPAHWLEAWAAAPGIYRIEPWVEPELAGEVGALNNAGQRVNGMVAGAGDDGLGYLDWLFERGFDTSSIWSFAVNVSDTGLDKGNDPGSWHPDFYGPDGSTSRVVYAKDWTADAGGGHDGVDGDGHGTNCAGIVGGYNDDAVLGSSTVSPTGYRFGLGVAPNVRLGGSKLFDFNGSWGLSAGYDDIESFAWNEGARISSNSWGADVNSYTWDARTYDELVRDADPATPGNQPMVILFAAGNDGPLPHTVGTPGNAKNVITLAAAENWWPGYSSCGWSSTFQDSPGDDIAYYSSRGPTEDGRIKPDLAAVAHGWVTARGSQAGSGCGDPYAGADSLLYRNFNGTSAATPAAAGSAALFYQHVLQETGSAPSPALVKAALVATARDLVGGVDATSRFGSGMPLSAVPNNSQGWGLIDVGTLFDEVETYRFDQEETFGASGESWTVGLGISSVSRPVKVVLAWTDAPGTTSAAPWMNDLDLEVTHAGTTYRGNVMSGGYSVAGGDADFKNNVEVVHLPAGSSGGVSIRVRATNIAADGVPGNADVTDQDFALYVYNAADCAPIDPPASVQATTASNQSIAVDWSEVPEAQAYRVYRSAGDGDFIEIAEVQAPQSAYLDEQVPAGATYTYTVRSVEGCESENSHYASATPAGSCVLPPYFAGLESVGDAASSECAIVLSWSAASSQCGAGVRYDVHRSLDPAFSPSNETLVASGLVGTSHVDASSLVSGGEYVYLVRAVDTSHGVPDDNGVKLSASASGGEVTRSALVRAPIPRLGLTPVTSSIIATEPGTIVDLNVSVDIDHSAPDELLVTFEGPSGTSVTLHDHQSAAPEGIDTVYDTETLPSGPGSLADFDGQTFAGSWTLGVLHDHFGASGEFVEWAISATLDCESGAAEVGEASASGQTLVTKGLGGLLQVHYTGAPFADETRIYVARRQQAGDAPSWESAFCGFGGETAEISPSALPAGEVQLLLPVGARGGELGSLGLDSAGSPRSPSSLPSCPVAWSSHRAGLQEASFLEEAERSAPHAREAPDPPRARTLPGRQPRDPRGLRMTLDKGRRAAADACP